MRLNEILVIITVAIVIVGGQPLANSTRCFFLNGICVSLSHGSTTTTTPQIATCHLTCHNKHCRTICTTALPTFSLGDVKQRRQIIKSKLVRRKQGLYNVEHEPFDAKDNLFSSPNDATAAPIFEVTPLTISETELEEELRKMSTLLYPIKQHDEQYDDEQNEESPPNPTETTDTTPFTAISERFTDHTAEPDPPPTTTEPTTTTTTTTSIFPTLLPQPPFEPLTRGFTPSRQTVPPTALPLPPAPPNILPPSAVRARIISPPGFSPKPPGLEPDKEETDEENEDNEEVLPDKIEKLTKKITPPNCVNPSHQHKVKPSQKKKKKKFVVTFSTDDFDDLEDEEEEEEPPEKIKKKILKPLTRRPNIKRPKISIVRQRKKCPPPEICEPNCGIFVDEDGCQGCRCLWISGPCDSDLDCRGEGQFCDLGRCECAQGFEYDEQNSGVCRSINGRRDRTENVRRVGSLQNAGPIVPPLNRLVSGRSGRQLSEERSHLHKVLGGFRPFETHWRARRNASTTLAPRNRKRIRVRTTTTTTSTNTMPTPNQTTKKLTTIKNLSKSVKNSLVATTTLITTIAPTTPAVNLMFEKPMREERLQWPGPCTIDGDCPPGLYCIASDCWALPEKSVHADFDIELKLLNAETKNSNSVSIQRVIWTTTVDPLTSSSYITVPVRESPTSPPLVTTSPTFSTTTTNRVDERAAQPPGVTPPIVTTRSPAEIVADAEARMAAIIAKAPKAASAESFNPSKKSNGNGKSNHPMNEPSVSVSSPIFEFSTTHPTKDDFLLNFDLPADRNDAIENKRQRQIGTNININQRSVDIIDTAVGPKSQLQTPNTVDIRQPTPNEEVVLSTNSPLEQWPMISDPTLWTGDLNDSADASNQLNRRLHHSKTFTNYDYDNVKNAENIFAKSVTVATKRTGTSRTTDSIRDGNEWDHESSTTAIHTINYHKKMANRNGVDPTETIQNDVKRIENVDYGNADHKNDVSNHFSSSESNGFIVKTGPIITKYEVNRQRKISKPKTHSIGHRHDLTKGRSISARIIDDYSAHNRMRRPVRVQIHNAKSVMRDECATDADCGGIGAPANARRVDERRVARPIYGRGVRLLCCTKRWCDLSDECSTARFCLPDCRYTKLTHLIWARPAPREAAKDERAPLLDLIYD